MPRIRIAHPCPCSRSDWHYWSFAQESGLARGTQLFLMLYLVDTSPANGCLRVLPRSHLGRVELDELVPAETESAHGGRENWGKDLQADPELPQEVQEMVSTWPGAVDVAVKAGDLIIGDSRLYHAAYENKSPDRRTCITMWYLDWDQCTPELRATYTGSRDPAAHPCGIPCATEHERALMKPLVPDYDGDLSIARQSSRLLGDWGHTPIEVDGGAAKL